jgi:hypothetical protein
MKKKQADGSTARSLIGALQRSRIDAIRLRKPIIFRCPPARQNRPGAWDFVATGRKSAAIELPGPLRYTGTGVTHGETGAKEASVPALRRLRRGLKLL